MYYIILGPSSNGICECKVEQFKLLQIVFNLQAQIH